jgi:DtxR family Mn-dependent transcriptional regulator
MPHLRPSSTIEDYLQAIYQMERDGRSVIASRLAEKMGVSLPTVTATIARMQRDGLVAQGDRRAIKLTPEGVAAAESIMRRHRLTERLLTDLLGLGWADAHEEAHLIEHAISPRVEERIIAVLGNPRTCPHGNPIPGAYTEPLPPTMPLTEAKASCEFVVDGINEEAEEDHDLMRFFEQNGLVPGSRLRVVEVAPYNHTVTVEVNGRPVTLGLSAAQYVRLLVPEA